MKFLIVRMWPDVINVNSYNCQELGLAKALIRMGHSCDVVLYTNKKESYEDDYEFDGKNIHIFHLKAKKFLKNCFFEKKLYQIAKNYDIVQSSEYDQLGNLLLKKHCKKMVIYHGPYKSMYTLKYNIKCLLSDFIYLFNSNYKKTQFLAKSNLAKEFLNKKGFKNVETIGVGLDADMLVNNLHCSNDVEKIIDNKNKYGYKYLLYIGKIEQRRNILFLIKLFSSVVKQDERARLVMVGKGNKNYIYKVKKLINKLDLKDKVVYMESLPQREISYLYENSSVFLLPTRYEIFGMVILESVYYGLPIITTLNGGSSTVKSELIHISNLNNMNEWINSCLDILKDSKPFTDKINLSWDEIALHYIKLLK